MSLELEKREDYIKDPENLLREQYKNKPNLREWLENFANQAQDLENAIFTIRDLNLDFGVLEDASRDNLNKTAIMFGVQFPEQQERQDLIFEIRAAISVIFSNARIEDVVRVPKFLYSLDADWQESGDGGFLSIFGSLIEKQYNLLFRTVKKLMPAGKQFYGIIESSDGRFGFERFNQAGNWRGLNQPQNQVNSFCQIAVDKNGVYLLG